MSENLPETYDDDETETGDTDDTGRKAMSDTDNTDRKAMDDTLDEQIPDPSTASDEPGGLTGPQDETYDPIELFDHHVHRTNGDETIVLLMSFGRGYQALAVDVDKAGEILATEEIGDAEDRQSAVSMCRYWVEQHPKGILGGEEGDDAGAGGFLEKLGLGGDGA